MTDRRTERPTDKRTKQLTDRRTGVVRGKWTSVLKLFKSWPLETQESLSNIWADQARIFLYNFYNVVPKIIQLVHVCIAKLEWRLEHLLERTARMAARALICSSGQFRRETAERADATSALKLLAALVVEISVLRPHSRPPRL